MKKLIGIAGILALTGCATWAPYNYQEHCAMQGMLLQGVTDSNGSAAAFSYGSNPVFASSSGSAISCRVAETPKDKCEVDRILMVASPKADYNESVGTKRLINGAADLLIIPGVVASVIYDGQKSDAIKQSHELNRTTPHCDDSGRLPASEK